MVSQKNRVWLIRSILTVHLVERCGSHVHNGCGDIRCCESETLARSVCKTGRDVLMLLKLKITYLVNFKGGPGPAPRLPSPADVQPG
jgi:hypothetical protein